MTEEEAKRLKEEAIIQMENQLQGMRASLGDVPTLLTHTGVFIGDLLSSIALTLEEEGGKAFIIEFLGGILLNCMRTIREIRKEIDLKSPEVDEILLDMVRDLQERRN